jgi:hypothetical protein
MACRSLGKALSVVGVLRARASRQTGAHPGKQARGVHHTMRVAVIQNGEDVSGGATFERHTDEMDDGIGRRPQYVRAP